MQIFSEATLLFSSWKFSNWINEWLQAKITTRAQFYGFILKYILIIQFFSFLIFDSVSIGSLTIRLSQKQRINGCFLAAAITSDSVLFSPQFHLVQSLLLSFLSYLIVSYLINTNGFFITVSWILFAYYFVLFLRFKCDFRLPSVAPKEWSHLLDLFFSSKYDTIRSEWDRRETFDITLYIDR